MAATFEYNKVGVSDASGNNVIITPDGQLHTVMSSKVDEGNSSIIPLNSGVTFTGTSIDILNYSVVGIAIWADQESGTDGLSVEFSVDNINWDHCDVYTIAANTGKTFSLQPIAKYLRVRYTNGAVNQGAFRLQVLLHKTYVKPSSHRVADPISGQDDAELVKAVATGQNPAGVWINGQYTQAGNYKISLEEFENLVSINGNSQLKTSLLDETGRIQQFDPLFPVQAVQDVEHLEIHEGDHYYIEDFDVVDSDGVVDFCVQTPDTEKQIHMTWAFQGAAQTELLVFRKATAAADGVLVAQQNNNNAYSWVGTHTPAGASATVLTDTTENWTPDALIGQKVYNLTDGSYGTITDNDATTVTVAALVGGIGNNFEQDDQYEINNSSLVIETNCTISSDGVRIAAVSSGDSINPARGVPGGTKRTDELILARNTKYIYRFISRLDDNIISYKATWYEHTPS